MLRARWSFKLTSQRIRSGCETELVQHGAKGFDTNFEALKQAATGDR